MYEVEVDFTKGGELLKEVKGKNRVSLSPLDSKKLKNLGGFENWHKLKM